MYTAYLTIRDSAKLGTTMNLTAILIILVVLGVIASNIMLLKYSAKFNLKNLNQDPIEKAKDQLKQQQDSESKEKDSN